MRTREKPLYIRKWVRKTFPWIHGVLKNNGTPGFLGHWLESYILCDFRQDPYGAYGVDYYYSQFRNMLTHHDDSIGFLQPYAPYRHTASNLKTLLVTGIQEGCPFCILLQENEQGKCRFMDVLFPSDEEELDLLVFDVQRYLETNPVPLPILHKGTLWSVTQ